MYVYTNSGSDGDSCTNGYHCAHLINHLFRRKCIAYGFWCRYLQLVSSYWPECDDWCNGNSDSNDNDELYRNRYNGQLYVYKNGSSYCNGITNRNNYPFVFNNLRRR